MTEPLHAEFIERPTMFQREAKYRPLFEVLLTTLENGQAVKVSRFTASGTVVDSLRQYARRRGLKMHSRQFGQDDMALWLEPKADQDSEITAHS